MSSAKFNFGSGVVVAKINNAPPEKFHFENPPTIDPNLSVNVHIEPMKTNETANHENFYISIGDGNTLMKDGKETNLPSVAKKQDFY